jgi:hypothetical protein
VLNYDGVRSLAIQNVTAIFWRDFEQIEEGFGTEQPVMLYPIPAAALRHMVEPRIMLR